MEEASKSVKSFPLKYILGKKKPLKGRTPFSGFELKTHLGGWGNNATGIFYPLWYLYLLRTATFFLFGKTG